MEILCQIDIYFNEICIYVMFLLQRKIYNSDICDTGWYIDVVFKIR